MALPADVIKLLEDLKSPKEEIRKKSVISLGRYNLPEVKTALSGLTNDSSTAVRYFAKKAMKDFESMTAAQIEHSGGFDISQPSSIINEQQASPAQIDEAVKKTAAMPSSDLFDRSGGSLTKILNDLKNPDENIKIEAIKKLGEQKEVVATEPLLGLIHDSVKSVRLYAVQSLGLIGENRVLTPLLNLLNSEQDAFVVATLVKAIARVGGAQLIPIIARYLKDPDARTRANTIEALEIIGDPKIIKFLIPLLQDENNRVKANTIKVLSKFGKTNMFEKLEEMLQSDDVSIRGSAIYALSAIGGEQVIELLEKAKNDEDTGNIKKLAEGLAKINTDRSMELLRELCAHPDKSTADFAASLCGGKPEPVQEPEPEPEREPIQAPVFQAEKTVIKETPVENPVSKPAAVFEEPSRPEPSPQKFTSGSPQTKKASPEPVDEMLRRPAAHHTQSHPPAAVEIKTHPQAALQFGAAVSAQPQLTTFKTTGAPRNFNMQDFENLWNDTLLLLNNFQKNHPDFSKEQMLAFLKSLESVIE